MGVTSSARPAELPQLGGQNRRSILALFAIAGLAAGCGDGNIPCGKVSGTVTLDGQPLAAGTIYFVPKAGPAASGTIENGHYQLSTYATHDGAVVGEHQVYFALATDDSHLADYTQEDYAAGKPAPQPVVKCQIPPRYLAPTTSELQARVTDADNTRDFSLTTKPRGEGSAAGIRP